MSHDWDDLREKYWPLYCEENVWHLCEALPEGTAQAFAVFVSNPEREVAVFRQRSATSDAEAVIWDYHVILLIQDADGWFMVDADSTLDTPCPADVYLNESFPQLPEEHARHRPLFRLVPADEYRSTLSTNRSHMRSPDGSWRSPPPPRPAIGKGTNLMHFVEMEQEFVGRVLDLPALRAELGPEAG